MESGNEAEEGTTGIGTQTIDHPKRVFNPVTDEYEDLTKLSEGGYKRRFLALLSASTGPDHVDMGSSPIFTFDEDRWVLSDDLDGQIVVKKREAETAFDEVMLDAEE